ncbi:GNAT family N-acetyltransferase [Sphingopyxis terrae subsp. ummariensis]|nr:GNAT family N-acetyltransferase [Sphingopyxis terrae subsp. ummariensis]
MARDVDALLPLCSQVFPNFERDYLDRLRTVADPVLCRALFEQRLIGFKLGYRRGRCLFYSWLGGVDREFRGRGIAAELMARQHELLSCLGYQPVETRTRASNRAMLILNLQCSFEVSGYENNANGVAVVSLRKMLPGKEVGSGAEAVNHLDFAPRKVGASAVECSA